MIQNILHSQYISTIKFTAGNRIEVFKLITRIKKEKAFLLRYSEAYNIYSTVRNTGKIIGEIAEVGTFNGASAKLIADIKGDKKLFIFDSFEGLPEPQAIDSKKFYKGQFKSDYSEVKQYLSPFPKVYIFKGYFPQENSEAISDQKFSFVHLDIDLYEPTRDCLNYFYPKMSKGGCIISHDYCGGEGVLKAFHEFFEDKPEVLIEMLEDQILVVKL